MYVCRHVYTHCKTKQTTAPTNFSSSNTNCPFLGPPMEYSAPSDTSCARNICWRQNLVSITAQREVWFRIQCGRWWVDWV